MKPAEKAEDIRSATISTRRVLESFTLKVDAFPVDLLRNTIRLSDSADMTWRALLSFLSRPGECWVEVDVVSFAGERPHGQRLHFCQQERDLD